MEAKSIWTNAKDTIPILECQAMHSHTKKHHGYCCYLKAYQKPLKGMGQA